MALAFVKSAKGLGTTATTTPAFGSATTSGNLIVLGFASDDYNGTVSAGWTQSTGMEQQGFHGGYCWWCISNGFTTAPSYVIATATTSAWVLAEFAGNDPSPYDISNGQFVNTSAGLYTTPAIAAGSGQRLLVSMMGGSNSTTSLAGAYTSWLNSFIAIDNNGNASGNACCSGLAYRVVTGNGVTTFSSGASYPTTVQSRSGLIISFKEAAAGATFIAAPNPLQFPARIRAATR